MKCAQSNRFVFQTAYCVSSLLVSWFSAVFPKGCYSLPNHYIFITLTYLLMVALTSKSQSLIGSSPPPYGAIPFPQYAMTNIVIDVRIVKIVI